jgi:hypothetical protein
MSSNQEKQEELKHTGKPDCSLCKKNKESFVAMVITCYESASPQAGEITRRF